MVEPSPEAVIETRGLRRVFKTRNRQVEAVAGVDLNVRRGEIFGFLGPNGAGKTTTLRMLATLLPPSGGTARVAGCELATQQARIRERIGYVGHAEGTPEDLKRAIAGDVVRFSIAGDQQRALDVIKDQPFVREAKLENGSVLLYVDRGEVAMPAILRLLDGAGLQLMTVELHRPSL